MTNCCSARLLDCKIVRVLGLRLLTARLMACNILRALDCCIVRMLYSSGKVIECWITVLKDCWSV